MIIDCHVHYLPEAYIAAAAGLTPEVRRDGNLLFLGTHSLGEIAGRLTSVAAILEGMVGRGVQGCIISPPPFTLRYDADALQAERMTRILNEGMASAARYESRRLRPLGTLPLQHPSLAVRELVRGVVDLGLSGMIIGTQVQGAPLDEEAFLPVFETARELGAVLFIHPDYVPRRSLSRYYLVNTVGNPFETTAAVASLIFGGVLTQLPGLKILCAHGGGAIAFLLGRLHHGWTVRPESRVHLGRPPAEVLRTLYFDSITHSPVALEFLINTVGGDRVLYGTDDPFDMADQTPLGDQVVAGRPIAAWARQWAQTARELFRFPPSDAAGTPKPQTAQLPRNRR